MPQLFVAAMNNKIGTTRACIECNADIDLPNNDGRTPLAIAAQNGARTFARHLFPLCLWP